MTNLPITNKSLGQHWLTDQATLKAICDAGDITANDTVLEVGPGPGSLTKLIVGQAKQVVAVEFDENLAAKLSENAPANLSVIHQDILQFDLGELPADYKVIANIPYYLTSKLVRVLSETPNPASLVVLLIQKEVAERIAAKPGEMSLLSVSAQFYWGVSLGINVPARLFTPPPKVDSQVIILRRRAKPLFENVDTKVFFQLVKAGFSARRKTLLNALSGGLRMSKEETKLLLEKAKIQPSARAQTLSLPEWHQLYQSYTQK